MFESILIALIYIALIALAVYIALWVLGEIGIQLPPQVVKIIWVVAVLVILLVLFQTLSPVLKLR